MLIVWGFMHSKPKDVRWERLAPLLPNHLNTSLYCAPHACSFLAQQFCSTELAVYMSGEVGSHGALDLPRRKEKACTTGTSQIHDGPYSNWNNALLRGHAIRMDGARGHFSMRKALIPRMRPHSRYDSLSSASSTCASLHSDRSRPCGHTELPSQSWT